MAGVTRVISRAEGRLSYVRCPTPLDVRSDYVCETCGLAVPVTQVMDQGEHIVRVALHDVG